MTKFKKEKHHNESDNALFDTIVYKHYIEPVLTSGGNHVNY